MIAKREDKATGKVSFERRYYLSSITEVEVFAEATRAHWGVENSLHFGCWTWYSGRMKAGFARVIRRPFSIC